MKTVKDIRNQKLKADQPRPCGYLPTSPENALPIPSGPLKKHYIIFGYRALKMKSV